MRGFFLQTEHSTRLTDVEVLL